MASAVNTLVADTGSNNYSGPANGVENPTPPQDTSTSQNPGGPVDGWYGYAWYINQDSGGSSTPAKNWTEDDFKSNPNAESAYLNPNGAEQYANLQGMAPNTDALMQQASDMVGTAGIGGQDLLTGAGIDGDVNIDRINHVDIEEEKNMLQQLTDAQRQQAILNADHTVSQGTSELQRSLEDAQEQYQTQRNQIDADEARAKDNQALYSEARGDRGGIGQAQYDSIMNTAATNRYTVQKEQSKAAQAVQRQIADLRANGEFEKANQLLSITQDHLSKLMQLYTWAKETNLNIDQFNTQIAQWEENYKMQLLDAELNVENLKLNTFNTLHGAAMDNFNTQMNIAQATGSWADGTPTWQAKQQALELLRQSGNALLQAGIAPSVEQLAAMGMTTEQAIKYLKKYFPNG